MLRKYSEIFRTLCGVADLGVVAAAWLVAYVIRFRSDFVPPPPAPPVDSDYVILGLASLPLFYLILRSRGLYEVRRGQSSWKETRDLLWVTGLGAGIIAAGTFFWHSFTVSRLVILIFGVACFAGLATLHAGIRASLRLLRRRGLNQRNVLLVGNGALAHRVYEHFNEHSEAGFSVVGFLGPGAQGPGEGQGPPCLGGVEALRHIVTRDQIDQVVVALDRSDPIDTGKLLDELAHTTAGIRIVPDLQGHATVAAGIEDFVGLPMIRLIESPILGWDEVFKRAFDITVSAAALLLLSPVLASIAGAIGLTVGRPVLYWQERMSLDGRLFRMVKFQTMVPDAESSTGPRWAVADDPRCTPLGGFLRRTSLDELPQLWNVLRGEMSLVGPRPERPDFIATFCQEVPGYMLRHKLKGGLTGWAQVNGCRGNTSVAQRLRYDLEYAKRWSLLFDVKILALTLLRSFRDPNAY